MDDLSKLACVAFGFKESGMKAYPCHWCGNPTALLDAEDFHVCEKCQLEHAEIGYDAMKGKYPHAGKDERNSEYFKEEAERNIARAKRLTREELQLIVERGCGMDQELANRALAGEALDQEDQASLGHSAEQYIDDW